MKKKFILGIILGLALTACGVKDTNIETSQVNDKLYSFVYQEDEVIDFDNKELLDITYRTIKDQPLNPYFSLHDYANLYADVLKEGYQIKITTQNYDTIFRVLDDSNNLYFSAQFNAYVKTIFYGGDFSETLVTANDYSKTSLTIRGKFTTTLVQTSSGYKELSYKNVGYTSFVKGGIYYFPLSLLETVIASNSGIRHIFNYNRLIQYQSNEQLSKQKYLINGIETTSNIEMANYIANKMYEMPDYLIKDRLNCFNFIMQYQYGLKIHKGISDMMDYLSKQSFYSDFSSTDPIVRREALYKAFALLDDGHSSIRDNDDMPWNVETSISPYGEHVSRLYEVKSSLTAQRNLTPGQVYYSSDEKLAFFSFDSFTFATSAYDDEGNLKESLSDYNSEDFDTFFYFVKMLNQIKEKGNVKDVVIDISINGGGTVGILFKLLPLLSKDNSAAAFLANDALDTIVRYKLECDSNGDGNFDINDCFGNDFNIHILSSEFSFSCANAFAYYVQKNNICDVIGQTSGGGECTVNESYLPSGEHFYHSSLLRIGWSHSGIFSGDEDGAPVDLTIPYEQFYDLDALQKAILNNK